MVEHVGKCGLETDFHSLPDVECFGQAEAGGRGAGPLQDANSGVAETPGAGWSGREGGEVEELRAGLALVEIVRGLVGTQERATIDDVGVGLIVGIADARR